MFNFRLRYSITHFIYGKDLFLQLLHEFSVSMSTLKISKENLPSRLFEKDLNHVKRKVKESGYADTRFKDKSSTIHYYVRLGIGTETRTETANNLDDKIIKASQKEVVIESLLPVKNSIDGLTNVMQEFKEKQDAHFTEANRKTDILMRRIENLNEQINGQLGDILKQIMTTGKVSEESLRNVIVPRSIHYVFLFGYKAGRIEPSDNAQWTKLVSFAHQKAQQLSLEELQHLAEGTLNAKMVEKLTNEMFTILNTLEKLCAFSARL